MYRNTENNEVRAEAIESQHSGMKIVRLGRTCLL